MDLKPYSRPPRECPACGERPSTGSPIMMHYRTERVETRIERRFLVLRRRVEVRHPAHLLCRCIYCGYEYRMEPAPGLQREAAHG